MPKTMKNGIFLLIAVTFMFSGCITARKMDRKGVSRIKTYEILHKDIPPAFNDFRIAFASDFHYKSILQEKGLNIVTEQLKSLHADAVLLTGDYDCDFIPELFSKLGEVKTSYGTYAVLGNHDTKCREAVDYNMRINGITLLEHIADTVHIKGQEIIIAGVRNPFNLNENGIAPTTTMHPDDFVILLAHTPDYAEKGDITNTDLVLSGHTHGGQVTLFGLYAPVTNSGYGQKFRTGRKKNSKGQTVIITNGIGTSRKQIRIFAPSEIVLLILKSEK